MQNPHIQSEGKLVAISAIMGLFLLLSGCTGSSRPSSGVDDPSERAVIHRYGEALFSIDPDSIRQGLDSISGEFRFFLGDDYGDSSNIARISDFIHDPLIRELSIQCRSRYRDVEWLEEGLGGAFSRLEKSFPSFVPPDVYTYVSGLYYEAPVQFQDTVLLIALDMFLGARFEPYRQIGLPQYMIRRFTDASILPYCIKEIGYTQLSGLEPGRTLLDQMVFHGKVLYLAEIALPSAADSALTGYTPGQLEWCRDHESELWAFLIDQELLFTTESFTINKFIQDGPFTSGMPPESPAMLGRWLGWRIVRSYMQENRKVSMEQLFSNQDAQALLNRSGYKPVR